MSKFKQYLEIAQDIDLPKTQSGIGTKIKNFVLNRAGEMIGKKIIFVQGGAENQSLKTIGEIKFDAAALEQLKTIIDKKELIVLEDPDKGADRKYRAIKIDESGKNILVYVK